MATQLNVGSWILDHSEYMDLKEKAETLDEFGMILNYQPPITLDKLKTIKELADQQIQDISARMSTKPYVSVPTSEYNRLWDKAKMYDNIVSHEPIDEWKEKAKKWDRLLVGTFHIHESTDSKVVFDWINEWHDKANRWDSGLMEHINRYWVPPERVKELEERAKKWDKLCDVWENPDDLLKKLD